MMIMSMEKEKHIHMTLNEKECPDIEGFHVDIVEMIIELNRILDHENLRRKEYRYVRK